MLFDGEKYVRGRTDLAALSVSAGYPAGVRGMVVVATSRHDAATLWRGREKARKTGCWNCCVTSICCRWPTRRSPRCRGQRFKGVLVTLMAVDPEVWLLDEPFASGMDRTGSTSSNAGARSSDARAHDHLPRRRSRCGGTLLGSHLCDPSRRSAGVHAHGGIAGNKGTATRRRSTTCSLNCARKP